MFKKPLFTMKVRASMMPIRKPEATMAGMMGTKMSPSVLIIRLGRGCFAAAAAFTSSLVAAVRPVTFRNSS